MIQPGTPPGTLPATGKPLDEKLFKFITSANINKRPVPTTVAGLREAFARAQGRIEDAPYQMKFDVWLRDKMMSPMSGIQDELQVGHILPAEMGGKAEMENLIMQTREENYENLAAQIFMQNLPEKEFVQEQFWTEIQTGYVTDLGENLKKTEEKLNEQGQLMNEAVAEKVAYDTKKKYNVRLYNKELAKIRMQRDWAERVLRKEIRDMETKNKRSGFAGDPVSERQIIKLNYFINQYKARYDEIFQLRETEKAKTFDLPEQILRRGPRFETLDVPIVVKGRGPELANPDNIINMVKYEDLAFDRAYIMEFLTIIDLSRYLGVNKDLLKELKQPTEASFVKMQEQAKKKDIELFGPVPFTAENYFDIGSDIPETLGMSTRDYADYTRSLREDSTLGPVSIPKTARPTVLKPGRVMPTATHTAQFQGNVSPAAEAIFSSLGLEFLQGGVDYSNIPAPGEGVPVPYTRSGWKAKLEKDRAAGVSKVKKEPDRTGETEVVEGTAAADKFDENAFLESDSFVAAVQSIALEIFDDRNYT